MLKKQNPGYEEVVESMQYIYATYKIFDLSLYYVCQIYFDKKKYNVSTIYKYVNRMIKTKNKKVDEVLKSVENNIEFLKTKLLNEDYKILEKKYHQTVTEIDTKLFIALESDKPIVETLGSKAQLLGQFKRLKKTGALHEYHYFKKLETQKDKKSIKLAKKYYVVFNKLDSYIKAQITDVNYKDIIDKTLLNTKLENKLIPKENTSKEKVKKI